ncbi:MAG: glycosyltransferase family 2 protein [Lachnospiraceae bacterium]|nr:glycosyltransferase family 2 protein [Lachnospiraceae bacterium]
MGNNGKQPRVAFFMCCYNHEKYVGDAIESILNQTYPHWELFIANDGSTDRSGEVIASYKDPRIHFHDLKENTQLVGAQKMLTDLIEPMDFDYIQMMNSDDLIDKEKIEKQIRFFEAHPEYAACFTMDEVIFSEGSTDYPADYSVMHNRSRYQWMDQYFQFGNCMNGVSALIRKDVFYELDTINQRFIVLADFRHWYMIACKYPIYLLQEKLTYYRRHATNLSSHTMGSAICFFLESARVLRDVILPMDKKSFRRAHYARLVYKQCESDEDLWAEKFIVLVNGITCDKTQVAIDWYYDHCKSDRFIEILREKYGFGNRDFTNLKENGGLAYAANDIAMRSNRDPYLPQKMVNSYHAWQILIDAFQNDRFNIDTFGNFTYVAMQQLSEVRNAGEEFLGIFTTAKMLCEKLREAWRVRKKNRNILFIVASDSDWRLNKDNTPVPEGKNTRFYVSYVNTMDILQSTDVSALIEEDRQTGTDIAEVHYIDLFDEKNQSLLFADEVVPELTDICYVDCMKDVYETYQMVLGYSLSVSQTCIMDQADYNAMLKNDSDRLQIFDGVYYY